MNLKDKVVVVTGASDGIGKQIALRLAREEAVLALIARDKLKLQDVCKEVKKNNKGSAEYYSCDIRQTKQLEKTVKSIISDFGRVDVLINNAGIWQKLMQADEVAESVVDDVINTNLSALIHITRLLLPTLRKNNESAIINVTSKSGVVAQDGQSVYSASKYGVRGFTEVLKADLKGSPVRVAGVYQSGTNTKMFEKTGEKFPTEKFTNPSDLADVVAYMLTRPKKIWLHDVRVEY